jgi:hypothetical protein
VNGEEWGSSFMEEGEMDLERLWRSPMSGDRDRVRCSPNGNRDVSGLLE